MEGILVEVDTLVVEDNFAEQQHLDTGLHLGALHKWPLGYVVEHQEEDMDYLAVVH